MRHEYGGLWTRKKLEILEYYLKFYSTALRKYFYIHYVDAFAGTGKQSKKTTKEQTELLPLEDLKGSVLTALDAQPGFNEYHFNDIEPAHYKALEDIKKQYPKKKISVTNIDANIFVKNFCLSLTQSERAVLFVDPFSTEFNWDSLKFIGSSRKIDLWLLFPLSATLRMTPKDGLKKRPEWSPKIDALLGTNQWENALYKKEKHQPPTLDMFGDTLKAPTEERLNPTELQKWVKKRLMDDAGFSFVADPVMLTNNNRPMFSFFFAVSNPDEKAWGLAQKVSRDILKKYQ